MLHVVGDDDDRVVDLQIPDQLFDLRRGDRIEGRRRLVHQQNLRIDGERSGDADALLLAAGEGQRARMQPVLHFVPQCGTHERLLHHFVQLAPVVHAADAKAVRDVVVDRFRERIRFLEHHTDTPPKRDNVSPGRVDVSAVDLDRALPMRVGDDVVHPVDRSNESRFAAARWPDERGDLALRDLQGDAVQHLRCPVIEIKAPNVDFDRRLLCRRLRIQHDGRRGSGSGCRKVHVDCCRHYGLFIRSSRRTASRAAMERVRMIMTSRNAPAHACRRQSS